MTHELIMLSADNKMFLMAGELPTDVTVCRWYFFQQKSRTHFEVKTTKDMPLSSSAPALAISLVLQLLILMLHKIGMQLPRLLTHP